MGSDLVMGWSGPEVLGYVNQIIGEDAFSPVQARSRHGNLADYAEEVEERLHRVRRARILVFACTDTDDKISYRLYLGCLEEGVRLGSQFCGGTARYIDRDAYIYPFDSLKAPLKKLNRLAKHFALPPPGLILMTTSESR